MKVKNEIKVSILVVCVVAIFAVAIHLYIKCNHDDISITNKPIAEEETNDETNNEINNEINNETNDKAVTLDKAGTYTMDTVEGNLNITAEEVTLKDTVIDGDLVIAESVGEGNVYLQNVKVKGKTIVNGGGENSIIVVDCQLYDVVVDKKNGKVRIVAKGVTQVGNVELHSGAKLEEDELTGEGYGKVSVGIEVPDYSEIIFEGNFDAITISAENTKINLEKSKVEELNIAEEAKGTTVEVSEDSTITNLEVNSKAHVTGKGKIDNAKIKVVDVMIEQKPQNIELEEGLCITEKNGENVSSKITVPEKEDPEKEVIEKKEPEKEVTEKEVTEKEITEKEVTEKEVTEKEVTEKEATKKEVTEKEATEKEATEKEVTEKEATEKEVTEKEEPEKEEPEKPIPRPVPAINSITSDTTTLVEGVAKDVQVVVNTRNINNGTEVIAELVNEVDNSSLNPAVKVSGEITSNTAGLTLPVTAEVVRGNYKIKVTCAGKEKYFNDLISILSTVEKVTNLVLDEYKITWDTVANAKNYEVILLKGKDVIVEVETDETEYNFAKEIKDNGGIYYVTVQAKGDGTTYLDGEVSDKLKIHMSDKVNWKKIVNYEELDTALYWFDSNNQPYRDGGPDTPFDKTKPTIIYVHGWLPNCVKDYYASDFLYAIKPVNEDEIEVNTVKAWIEDGYNVGLFNWCQLSDEPGTGFWGKTPYNAEAKIWVTDYPGINMRWRRPDNTFETGNLPDKTAAELFYDAYIKAMKGFEGDSITIAGHSLGNQMAIRLADLVDKGIEKGYIAPELMPDRVTLFDPYYSDSSLTYVDGKSPGKAASEIVKRLANKNNIVFEMYKSSDLSSNTMFGDTNPELENLCYHFQMKANYVGSYAEQHSASTSMYFWSKVYHDSIYRLDNADIGSRMGPAFRWDQTEGDKTINPEDDINEPTKNNTYVPQTDISLLVDGMELTNTAKDNCEEIDVNIGSYKQIETKVLPSDVTSKIVAFEKVSGDLNLVQLATNGIVKGLNEGKVLIKVFSENLSDTGDYNNTIEKYVMINVKKINIGQLKRVTKPVWVVEKITWEDIQNETNYLMILLKDTKKIFTKTLDKDVTEYNLKQKMEEFGDGNYTAKVQAKGDGNNYSDGVLSPVSDVYEKITSVPLDNVTNLVWDGSKISWNAVENANKYEVILLKGEKTNKVKIAVVETEEIEYNFSQEIQDKGTGTYIITVQAKGDGKYYLDAEATTESDEKTIAVLAQVAKPVWNGSKITWTAVENGINYEVILLENGNEKDTQTVDAIIDKTEYDCDFASMIKNGSYEVTVQAKGNGDTYFDGPVSTKSDPKEFYQLEKVVKPVWNGNSISWGCVKNASSYKVALYKNSYGWPGNEVLFSETVEDNVDTYDFTEAINSLKDQGYEGYFASVQALGDGTTYSNGEESDKSNQPIQLSKMNKPSWDGDKITWVQDYDSQGYEVTLFKDGVEIATQQVLDSYKNKYDFTEMIKGSEGFGEGSYTATVQAKGDGEDYSDGPVSEKSDANIYDARTLLQQVAQPVWTGDKITWTDVENATSYEVELLKDGNAIDTQTVAAGVQVYDFTAKITDEGEGIYTVTVKAKGDPAVYRDADVSVRSEVNDKMIKVTLDQVTKPVWDKTIITWTDVDNETEYEATLIKDSVAESPITVEAGTEGTVQYDFTSMINDLGSGTYKVKVQAKGNRIKYLDGPASQESDAKTLVALAEIEQPVWDSENQKMIKWTDIDNELGYIITLYQSYDVIATVQLEANVTEYDFTTQIDELIKATKHYIKVTVQAKGNGENYLNGPVSNKSQEKHTLEQVGQPVWSGDKITWSYVDYAGEYEVKLIKDGKIIDTQTVVASYSYEYEYDFTQTIKTLGDGTYTVTVQSKAVGYFDGFVSPPSQENVKSIS